MKYSVGQVIKIRSHCDIKMTLDGNGETGGVNFVSGMHTYCELTATISECNSFKGHPTYNLKDFPYTWTEEWLDTPKPVVCLPEDLFIV